MTRLKVLFGKYRLEDKTCSIRRCFQIWCRLCLPSWLAEKEILGPSALISRYRSSFFLIDDTELSPGP